MKDESDSKDFGSRHKPVTITVRGALGSGVMMLAAFLMQKLEEYGAAGGDTVAMCTPCYKELENLQESWKRIREYAADHVMNFKDKPVTLLLEITG